MGHFIPPAVLANVEFERAVAPYEDGLNAVWPDPGFDAMHGIGWHADGLRNFVSRATAPWRQKTSLLPTFFEGAKDIFIFVGERSDTGGDQMASVVATCEAAFAAGVTPHLIFSGGVEDPERLAHGEYSARRLRDQFAARDDEPFRARGLAFEAHSSLDQLSDNTGDQAYVMRGFVEGRLRAKRRVRLVICLPLEHMARWTLTFVWAYDRLDTELRQAFDLQALTLGSGGWEDKTRGGLTRADEAFLTFKDSKESWRRKFAGQASDRLRMEMLSWKELGYRCGVAKPVRADPSALYGVSVF